MGKRNTAIMILIVLGALVLLSGCFGIGSKESKKYKEVEQSTLVQLQHYYHEDFTIRSIRYVPQMGVYEMIAYPNKNQNMIFTVRTGGVNEAISDDYYVSGIIEDTTQYYNEYLKKFDVQYGGGLSTLPDADALYSKAYDNNWSFDYLQKNYKNQLYFHGLLFFFEVVTPNNKEEITKNLYAFYKKLYSEHYTEVSLRIMFYNPILFQSKSVKDACKRLKYPYPVTDYNGYVQTYDAGYFDTEYRDYCMAFIRIEFKKNDKMMSYEEFSKIFKDYPGYNEKALPKLLKQ